MMSQFDKKIMWFYSHMLSRIPTGISFNMRSLRQGVCGLSSLPNAKCCILLSEVTFKVYFISFTIVQKDLSIQNSIH